MKRYTEYTGKPLTHYVIIQIISSWLMKAVRNGSQLRVGGTECSLKMELIILLWLGG